MCQVNAYVIRNCKESEIMHDVTSMEVMGNNILLRDLLGNEKTLQTSIKKIDFLKHKIILA